MTTWHYGILIATLSVIMAASGKTQNRAVTLGQDTISLIESSKPTTIIILLQDPCVSCESELGNWWYSDFHDTMDCQLICLLTTSESSYSRYIARQRCMRIFPTAEILFKTCDSSNKSQDTSDPVNKFTTTTDVTPALLLWNNRGKHVMRVSTYDKLFQNSGTLNYNELAILDDLLKRGKSIEYRIEK